MLPIFMRLKIKKENQKGVTLFFPIILIWILMFVLLLAALPIVLLVSLLTWGGKPGKKLLYIYPVVGSTLWNLGGLYVHIHDSSQEIIVYFK